MSEALSHDKAQDQCESLADALCDDIKRVHGYVPRRRWMDARALCVFDQKGDPIATFRVETVQ